MSALCSHFMLISLQSSWKCATQVPTLKLAYLHQNSGFASSAYRRTPRARKAVASLKSSDPSFQSPETRGLSELLLSENGAPPNYPNPASTSGSKVTVPAELEQFLELVPARMRNELYSHAEIGDLIEVVMDLGREPIARFPSGDCVISEQLVQLEDMNHAFSKVGEFSDDNRAGINSSLHRISAMRNRKMQIIGLTCRVGRAISGSAEVVRDLVARGDSILVLGPPGVGKTTLIREIARMLANEHGKRVVVVDTSNEIGGDGDVPHAGIGRARRMQVPNVHKQHSVMIEAVENHMPQTIIIDEIGTELEALAASSIAQRGVQLVGTAHGINIDSIMKNPSLHILVGGIQSVIIGDEAARIRNIQKTMFERKGAPTFTCAVELISKTECRIHHRLDATVDAILAGLTPMVDIRRMGDGVNYKNLSDEVRYDEGVVDYTSLRQNTSSVSVYSYKILEEDILQAAKTMGCGDKVDVTDDTGRANAIVVTSQELEQNPWIRGVAKFYKLPIYILKTNTMEQMVKAVRVMLGRNGGN